MYLSHHLLQSLPASRSRGMTLLEILLVLMVGAFIMVGAGALYSNVMTQHRINETSAAIYRLVENAQGLIKYTQKGQTGDYSELDNTFVFKAGIVPPDLNGGMSAEIPADPGTGAPGIPAAPIAASPWAVTGAWEFLPNLQTGDRKIYLKINYLPAGKVCVGMAMQGVQLGATSVDINGSGDLSRPVDPAAVATACGSSEGVTTATVTLGYVF